jgi:DNA-binding FadR family transcriptional regulator
VSDGDNAPLARTVQGAVARETGSKSDRIVDRILERLARDEWQAGDKLPSERTFATEFGVSRGVVREALRSLHLSGYIDTRLSEGSFVRINKSMSRSLEAASVVAGLSEADGLEVRQGLEIACACLAINRATPADLLRIDASVLDMRSYLEHGDFSGYLAATLVFHLSIASAAHSPALLELTTSLTKTHPTDQWIPNAPNNVESAEYSFSVHLKIAEAVHAKDMAAATAAIGLHYSEYPILQTLSER